MVAFGTSGLRGLAADLLAGPGYAYVWAFATYLRSSGQATPNRLILLGRDRRESSPDMAKQAISALRSAGLSPVYCGMLPTPALAHQALRIGAPAIMVTGSHIPADRNGLKFYRADGEIDKADEKAIAALAGKAAFPAPAHADLRPLPVPNTEALHRYVSRYKTAFPGPMLRGKRIGVYTHSSVAAEILADLASFLGAEVILLGSSGEFVAIDTEAIDEETATRLADWARRHRLDAIMSTDGDGDRPLLTDETGGVIRGDALGVISAIFLNADVVVTPVSSNPAIEKRLRSLVVRTKIGSPYVLAGMAAVARDHSRVVGFEANGGLLLGSRLEVSGAPLDALPTRDSVLPMLCAFAAAFESNVPLSKLVEGLGLPICLSGRVENFPRSDSDSLMATLRSSPQRIQSFLKGIGTYSHCVDIDGLQIYLDDESMIHLRPSGNAPEMRCYVSALTAARAAELLCCGLTAIEQSRHAFQE